MRSTTHSLDDLSLTTRSKAIVIRTTRPSRERRERGAAVVEFAIVLLPLLMLVLGIVEFGRIYSRQLMMQHAAREAAREIALSYDDLGMTSGLLQMAAEDIILDLVPVDDITDLAPTIQLCNPAVTTSQDAVVTLEEDLTLAIPLPDAVVDNVTVRAKAEMPCEG